MSQSWNLDPKKGDYVLSGGVPVETNSLQVPAYIRLKTKRLKWLYAPDSKYGSDYYTITKRPSENGNQHLETVGANALQPLVDDGRATDITVEVTGNSRNASSLDVTIASATGDVEQTTFKGMF